MQYRLPTAWLLLARGGVEDTRLEAKDTKKSEAKDTNASVFLRKKVLKFFFGRSQKKNGLEKYFSADLQNFNHSKIVLSSSRG